MQRSVARACFALALFNAATILCAKEPVSLERNGIWQVNYELGACHAITSFGTGTDEVSVRISKTQINDTFELQLSGQQFASKSSDYTLSIDFGLSDRPEEIEARAGLINKTPVLIMTTRLDGWLGNFKPQMTSEQRKSVSDAMPRLTRQQEAKVTTLTLTLPKKRTLQLKLGSMLGPMTALRACFNSLVRSWGYDPLTIAKFSKQPEPIDSGKWITTYDYPPSAIRTGRQSIIHFKLDVSEIGDVTGCTILYSTNPNEMNDLTCKLLQTRGKFKPALDANGNAVKSFYANSVRWIMPS